MGNSYSVAREEQEEDEFRRLVEAVEIAQQRSARQGDLENGLGFGYSFLGTEANRVQHAFHSSSDRVQPSAGLVGPALQIPQPVYQVAHTESEADFIPPRPSASGSSRSSSRSRSPEANVIIIPPPGVGGAYQMQPGLPGMPMGMQPQSLQPTIILAPPGGQQPATAVSPTMGPARPPTATSPAPIIVQPPPQFGRPTEWHYPHSSSAGARSTTTQRREDLPDEQYLEQELYKLRVKPGRRRSVASYNSWELPQDANMDAQEFQEEERNHRAQRRSGSPFAVTQMMSESAHDPPVESLECEVYSDNERRSSRSPTYRRSHDRHSRSYSRSPRRTRSRSRSHSPYVRSTFTKEPLKRRVLIVSNASPKSSEDDMTSPEPPYAPRPRPPRIPTEPTSPRRSDNDRNRYRPRSCSPHHRDAAPIIIQPPSQYGQPIGYMAPGVPQVVPISTHALSQSPSRPVLPVLHDLDETRPVTVTISHFPTPSPARTDPRSYSRSPTRSYSPQELRHRTRPQSRTPPPQQSTSVIGPMEPAVITARLSSERESFSRPPSPIMVGTSLRRSRSRSSRSYSRSPTRTDSPHEFYIVRDRSRSHSRTPSPQQSTFAVTPGAPAVTLTPERLSSRRGTFSRPPSPIIVRMSSPQMHWPVFRIPASTRGRSPTRSSDSPHGLHCSRPHSSRRSYDPQHDSHRPLRRRRDDDRYRRRQRSPCDDYERPGARSLDERRHPRSHSRSSSPVRVYSRRSRTPPPHLSHIPTVVTRVPSVHRRATRSSTPTPIVIQPPPSPSQQPVPAAPEHFEQLLRLHERSLATWEHQTRVWHEQSMRFVKVVQRLEQHLVVSRHGGAASVESVMSDLDEKDGKATMGAQVQTLSYNPPTTRKPYPSRPYAAGLRAVRRCSDDWSPSWKVFPLKAFRGSSYMFLRIEADWDDADLLRELSLSYDRLRTVWRKWFSLRSVRSITMVYADHTCVYPRRLGPAGVSPSKNMRLRYFLHHPDQMKGRHEFMQVLTARTDLGIEFVEGWQLTRISVAILLPVVASLILGVVYSILENDVSSAFTVAGYMTSAYSVCLVLLGLLNFVEF